MIHGSGAVYKYEQGYYDQDYRFAMASTRFFKSVLPKGVETALIPVTRENLLYKLNEAYEAYEDRFDYESPWDTSNYTDGYYTMYFFYDTVLHRRFGIFSKVLGLRKTREYCKI
jgi:hypothetical protein